MSDLIDRQALREDIEKIYKYDCQTFVVHYAQVIDDLSFIEPKRKKTGHWIDTDNYYQRWKCSECGCHTRDAEPNYCPNCGADMRGTDE